MRACGATCQVHGCQQELPLTTAYFLVRLRGLGGPGGAGRGACLLMEGGAASCTAGAGPRGGISGARAPAGVNSVSYVPIRTCARHAIMTGPGTASRALVGCLWRGGWRRRACQSRHGRGCGTSCAAARPAGAHLVVMAAAPDLHPMLPAHPCSATRYAACTAAPPAWSWAAAPSGEACAAVGRCRAFPNHACC